MTNNCKLFVAGAALVIGAAAATGVATAVAATAGADVKVATPKGTVSVTPVTNEIFRVTVLPADTSVHYLVPQGAVLMPDAPQVRTLQTPATVTLMSPTTAVSINRATGLVTFLDNEGNVLFAEKEGVNNNTPVKRISFAAQGAGHLYGAGERGHKPTLNGDTLRMFNRQNYGYTAGDPRLAQMGITIPWIASDKGFGVLVDDYNDALLTVGPDSITYTSDTPAPLAYYFVNAPEKNLAGTAARYSRLTGLQPLPPAWALGYITSKYGYRTQQETEGVVDTLKAQGYPVDGLVLDLYWYGKEQDMGRFEWNPDQWPEHRKMLADLKEKGVHTVLISQPYVNKGGAIDNYNEFASQGMLTTDSDGNTHDVTTWVGEAGLLDMSNPKTRQWLTQRYSQLTADGVDGWWGDLGDLEVHPLSAMHHNGMTASQYHNAYGNEWSKTIFDMLRSEYPDMRPLLLMRGGTTGLQRYGVMPWTTDVSRSWGGLQPQVNLMLSSGLSGLGYMSSDIGGFAVDPAKPTDPELYVRWLQMGAFTPVLRTHAQEKPEPYHYPQYADAIHKYIDMRYQWYPYNYTLAYENAAFGLPLARPLNFRGDNPGDAYAAVNDEYLWGDNVLVAPVMQAGATKRSVLFPAGEWISWWDASKRYQGGKTYTVPAPLERMPLFVKAGSFIPQYNEKVGNTGDFNPQLLDMRYYPSGQKTTYVLFDDDRKSPTSLSDKQYALTTFTGVREYGAIEITIAQEGTYPGMPEARLLTIEVPGLAKNPNSVTLDGEPLRQAQSLRAIRQYGYVWNPTTKTATFRLPIGKGTPAEPTLLRIGL